MKDIDSIFNEIEWLASLIAARVDRRTPEDWCWDDSIDESNLSFNMFFEQMYGVEHPNLKQVDRIALLTSLSVHIGCKLFEPILALKKETENPLSKMVGGIVNQYTEGLYPTLQTILFLSVGDDGKARLSAMNYLLLKSKILQRSVLRPENELKPKRVLKIISPTAHSPLSDSIIEMDLALYATLTESERYYDYHKIIERLKSKLL